MKTDKLANQMFQAWIVSLVAARNKNRYRTCQKTNVLLFSKLDVSKFHTFISSDLIHIFVCVYIIFELLIHIHINIYINMLPILFVADSFLYVFIRGLVAPGPLEMKSHHYSVKHAVSSQLSLRFSSVDFSSLADTSAAVFEASEKE